MRLGCPNCSRFKFALENVAFAVSISKTVAESVSEVESKDGQSQTSMTAISAHSASAWKPACALKLVALAFRAANRTYAAMTN